MKKISFFLAFVLLFSCVTSTVFGEGSDDYEQTMKTLQQYINENPNPDHELYDCVVCMALSALSTQKLNNYTLKLQYPSYASQIDSLNATYDVFLSTIVSCFSDAHEQEDYSWGTFSLIVQAICAGFGA